MSPPAQRSDLANIFLSWFDHWLKGERDVDLGPSVEVEDSSGAWRKEAAWPPSSPATSLWLTPAAALSAAPATATGSESLMLDPAHTQDPVETQTGASTTTVQLLGNLCPQPICARFATPSFKQAFRFSGIPRLHLTLVPSGPAGEVSAYLYDAGPNGLTRVGWGQVDLRFPDGGRTPHPVHPGKPTVVDFSLQPLDAVIPAGHQLVLMLSEGNTYDRLPGVPNYPVTLEVGKQASHLSLQEVTPSSGQFFTPPALAEQCCR